MGKFRKKRELLTLDLTPLIDVVFLLLIFFMVSTTFSKYGGIDIEIPTAHVEEEHKEVSAELIIDKNGVYFLSTKGATAPVNFEKIAAQLQGVDAVAVTADKNLKYQKIISTITALKKQGLKNIGINFTEEPN